MRAFASQSVVGGVADLRVGKVGRAGTTRSAKFLPNKTVRGVHERAFPNVHCQSTTAQTTPPTITTVKKMPIDGMGIVYSQIEVETLPGIALFDITPQIREALKDCGLTEGFVNVLSRHTTTALTINECEPRLMDDVRQFFRKVAPPDHPYLHNDLHLREAPENWPGGWKAWADQEPENAHSHLLSMLLGNSESIPVTNGDLVIGQWQSVILVELDGPRKRTVGVQLIGQMSK